VTVTLSSAPPRFALEVDDLTCTQGRHPVVLGATFSLAPGERLALTGENGSGKSTLLRTLAGLHPRHRGRIRLFGREQGPGRTDTLSRGLAWMPQRQPRGQFPFLVRELLASSGHLRAALEAAEGLGLSALTERSLNQLSGGQLQRAFLARALGSLARNGALGLLLADEPTSALDFRGQAEVADLLAVLPAAQVIVTHDASLARRCDRCLTLVDGRLSAERIY
jgi:ABC-type Mn2+/Zn2+ transport system ATPase subunit